MSGISKQRIPTDEELEAIITKFKSVEKSKLSKDTD